MIIYKAQYSNQLKYANTQILIIQLPMFHLKQHNLFTTGIYNVGILDTDTMLHFFIKLKTSPSIVQHCHHGSKS